MGRCEIWKNFRVFLIGRRWEQQEKPATTPHPPTPKSDRKLWDLR
jgi:hypothetical protein